MTISNSNFLFLFRLVYFQQFILANTHSASGNIILIFVIENGISNTSKYQNSVRWIQIKIDETFQKRNRFTIPMKLSFYENVWILYFFFFIDTFSSVVRVHFGEKSFRQLELV